LNDGSKLNDDEMRLFNHHFNAIHDRILKDLRKQGLFREIEFVPLKIKVIVQHPLPPVEGEYLSADLISSLPLDGGGLGWG